MPSLISSGTWDTEIKIHSGITGGTTIEGVKGDTTTTYMTAAEFCSGGSAQITGDFCYYV